MGLQNETPENERPQGQPSGGAQQDAVVPPPPQQQQRRRSSKEDSDLDSEAENKSIAVGAIGWTVGVACGLAGHKYITDQKTATATVEEVNGSNEQVKAQVAEQVKAQVAKQKENLDLAFDAQVNARVALQVKAQVAEQVKAQVAEQEKAQVAEEVKKLDLAIAKEYVKVDKVQGLVNAAEAVNEKLPWDQKNLMKWAEKLDDSALRFCRDFFEEIGPRFEKFNNTFPTESARKEACVTMIQGEVDRNSLKPYIDLNAKIAEVKEELKKTVNEQ